MNILHTRDNKKYIYIYSGDSTQAMQNMDMKQNMSSIQRMASLQKKNPWPRLSDLNKPNLTSPTSEPPVPRVYLVYTYIYIQIYTYVYIYIHVLGGYLFIYIPYGYLT